MYFIFEGKLTSLCLKDCHDVDEVGFVVPNDVHGGCRFAGFELCAKYGATVVNHANESVHSWSKGLNPSDQKVNPSGQMDQMDQMEQSYFVASTPES